MAELRRIIEDAQEEILWVEWKGRQLGFYYCPLFRLHYYAHKAHLPIRDEDGEVIKDKSGEVVLSLDGGHMTRLTAEGEIIAWNNFYKRDLPKIYRKNIAEEDLSKPLPLGTESDPKFYLKILIQNNPNLADTFYAEISKIAREGGIQDEEQKKS